MLSISNRAGDDLTRATRLALAMLVDREAYRVRSRAVAYENVARSIGMSSSWVKKFLRDSGEVREPRVTLFVNIHSAYCRLCERIEQENERDEVRFRALKGSLDALAQGDVPKNKTEMAAVARKRTRLR